MDIISRKLIERNDGHMSHEEHKALVDSSTRENVEPSLHLLYEEITAILERHGVHSAVLVLAAPIALPDQPANAYGILSESFLLGCGDCMLKGVTQAMEQSLTHEHMEDLFKQFAQIVGTRKIDQAMALQQSGTAAQA